MNRIKSYDAPHKGLRNAIAQFQLEAGKTNYNESADVEALYLLGLDVFKILTIHSLDENDVMLMELEKRCPGATMHDIDDHEQLHILQDNLEKLLTQLYNDSKAGQDVTAAGEELYLAISEFHGVYLEHTAEEERVTQKLLWENFTDEELASHRVRIMANIPPPTLLIWFRFIIPAQNFNDRFGFLYGFKQVAPAPFFEEVMKVVQSVLSEKEFHKIQSALG